MERATPSTGRPIAESDRLVMTDVAEVAATRSGNTAGAAQRQALTGVAPHLPGARRPRRDDDSIRSPGRSGSASTARTPRSTASRPSSALTTTRIVDQRRLPRRARPHGRLRRARLVLEAAIALAGRARAAPRPSRHAGLPGHRRLAADGRAGRRRARLAMDVRLRLRHDRFDRAAGSAASGPLWFANVWLARATIVITNLWLALPFDILMLVAGLASLPTEPIEAARVDGASPLQILRLVILPLLRPVIAIILVIRFADAFRIFDVVYVLTGSGPGNSTDVLSTFIYRQMFFKFDFAGGSAASILLVVVTALASILAVACASRRAGTLDGRALSPAPIRARRPRHLCCSSPSRASSSSSRSSGSSRPRSRRPPEIFTTPTTLLPQQPTLEHYGAVIEGDFRGYLINSLIAASGATALGLLLGIPAAFGFARYRLRFSGLLLSFTVVTRIFPPIALALAVLPRVPRPRADRHAVRPHHRLPADRLAADDLDPGRLLPRLPRELLEPPTSTGSVRSARSSESSSRSRCRHSASRRSSAFSSPGTNSSSR